MAAFPPFIWTSSLRPNLHHLNHMINTQNNFGASQVQAGSCKYYHVFKILASKITVVSSVFWFFFFLILYIYVFLDRGLRFCFFFVWETFRFTISLPEGMLILLDNDHKTGAGLDPYAKWLRTTLTLLRFARQNQTSQPDSTSLTWSSLKESSYDCITWGDWSCWCILGLFRIFHLNWLS